MNKKLLAMLMIHIAGSPSRKRLNDLRMTQSRPRVGHGARSRLEPLQRHPPHPDDGLRAPVRFRQWWLGLRALGPADLLENRERTAVRYRFTPYRQFSFSFIVIVKDILRTMLGARILDESGTGVIPNIGVRGINPLRSGVTQ